MNAAIDTTTPGNVVVRQPKRPPLAETPYNEDNDTWQYTWLGAIDLASSRARDRGVAQQVRRARDWSVSVWLVQDVR